MHCTKKVGITLAIIYTTDDSTSSHYLGTMYYIQYLLFTCLEKFTFTL